MLLSLSVAADLCWMMQILQQLAEMGPAMLMQRRRHLVWSGSSKQQSQFLLTLLLLLRRLSAVSLLV